MDPLSKTLIVSLAIGLLFESVAILLLFRYYATLDRRVRFGGGTTPRDAHLHPRSEGASPVDRRLRMATRRKTGSGRGDCDTCTALCCRYLTIPLDKPGAPEDFDWVRYAVSHEGVLAYIEDGDWYLEIGTPCRHLAEDHRCKIYDDRPKICRDYAREGCDQTADSLEEFGWDGYWTSVDRFEQWVDEEMGGLWRDYMDKQRELNRRGGVAITAHGGNGKSPGMAVTPTVKGRNIDAT